MQVKFTIDLIPQSLLEKFWGGKEYIHIYLGYFEIEHIDNPCFVTVAVNPKEYYKAFEDNFFNKKLKA